MKLTYLLPDGLTTAGLYAVAAVGGWELCQPDAEYVDDYDRMTTLEADTYTGEVTFRRTGKRWTRVEVNEFRAEFAVLEICDQLGLRIVFDPESCSLYH